MDTHHSTELAKQHQVKATSVTISRTCDIYVHTYILIYMHAAPSWRSSIR
jgi:hypothetical protein